MRVLVLAVSDEKEQFMIHFKLAKSSIACG